MNVLLAEEKILGKVERLIFIFIFVRGRDAGSGASPRVPLWPSFQNW